MKKKEIVESKGDQALRVSLIIFFVGAVLVTIGVVVGTSLYGIEAVMAWHAGIKPYLNLWRLFLFCVLIGKWQFWMNWLTAWAELPPEQHAFNLRYRWRFAMWLLVFEALIVQDGLAFFVQTLFDFLGI